MVVERGFEPRNIDSQSMRLPTSLFNLGRSSETRTHEPSSYKHDALTY